MCLRDLIPKARQERAFNAYVNTCAGPDKRTPGEIDSAAFNYYQRLGTRGSRISLEKLDDQTLNPLDEKVSNLLY